MWCEAGGTGPGEVDMRTTTNTAGHDTHVWVGGYLPLRGITERDACRAAALDALDATGGPLTLPDVPTAPSAGMTPLDAGGKAYDRAAWLVAYRATLAWFDLPDGTIWVPCLACGQLFDAWTCDVDHLIPRDAGGVGVVGNLSLMCHASNRGKSARTVHPATVARFVDAVGDMPTIVRGRCAGRRKDGVPYADVNPVDIRWHARPRRAGDGGMTATPYAGR